MASPSDISLVEHHVSELDKVIDSIGEPLEGNIIYRHRTKQRHPSLYKKVVNMLYTGSTLVINKICEIGVNAGHSACVISMGINRRDVSGSKFLLFDLGEHKYMEPCVSYVRKSFPKISYELVVGDSTKTVNEWIVSHPEEVNTYDVVHVDGGHTAQICEIDMYNADILLRRGGIMIVDDTNMHHLNRIVDRYIHTKGYIELTTLPAKFDNTDVYTHRYIIKS